MLIKTIRKFFMNAYVAIPMLCLFALTSYNSFAGRSTVREFTGEELFKGVFFLEGEYSELIPELASVKESYVSQHMSPQQKQNLDAERSRIINYIKDIDADFFVKFKNTVKSGNVQEIKNGFEESSSLLKEAINQTPQVDVSNAATSEGLNVVVYYYVDSVVQVCLFWPIVWDKTPGVDSKSSLFKEQMINSISKTASVIG